jgi:hypothetical protein
MTLTTHIRIIEPYPVQDILDECNRIVGISNPKQSDEVVPHSEDGTRWLMNEPGQGFPAWFIVRYGADAPIKEDLSDWEDELPENMPVEYSISLSFDTTYGYQADNGAGCSDLHAWIISELAPWLDERGLTWYWENEFTGEWFRGRYDLDQLGDAERGCLYAKA